MAYPRKRKKGRNLSKVLLKYIFPSLLVFGMILTTYGQNWYFDNGQGGKNWEIGKPIVNLKNAHNSASLFAIRQRALKLVNRDRKLNGLSTLNADSLLSQAAQLHAEDMLKRNFYAHVTPEGKTPTDRFQAIGGKEGVGENIMQQKENYGVRLTYGLAEKFQTSWMYSSGHRENILNPIYTHFGYGIAIDPLRGEVYAVQNFVTR